MYVVTESQLATHLDHIVDRIEVLRQMDLSLEADLQQALQQSQDTLGAIAMYRKMLSRAADYRSWPQRRAA